MADPTSPDSEPFPCDEPDDDTTSIDADQGEVGGSIGPYRLLQKIGEGGMGEVWLAEQTEPVRRRVALKVIKAGMDTKQVVARFEAERQALAMMNHPSIAQVFDAGETRQGRPYFVMEQVQGIPITEYCDRHRLTNRERLELFVQVCEGVQHAHQKAIIHRDLKPSNVLVTVQDGKPVPKIIDFGVAKATSERLTEKSMFTELGVLIGTPEYMSPEQAEMTGEGVDTRTDVYALGVMLYELLVGALPFDPKELRSAGFEGIVRKIREEEPPKPSTRLSTLGDQSTESAKRRRVDLRTLRIQLRGDLDWITMKALEKDRTRRYGSPAELAADVVRHMKNEPVLASPPSVPYRARKFVARHRFGVAASGLAIVALAGFGIAMAVQARRIGREAEAKQRVSEFLTELFRVSDPSETRGKSITARELLDKGAARIRGTLTADPAVRAELMTTMGVVYRDLGLYPQAEPLLSEALDTRKRLLGANDRQTLRVAWENATLQLLEGRITEADALFRATLDGQKRVLGYEDQDTLESMDGLACTYSAQGRFKEAESLFRETLDVQKRALGPEHRDTLKTTADLANVYAAQDRSTDAEALYRDVLETRKRVLGPEHPDTLASMYDLANAYEAELRPADADALRRATLELQKRVLGPDHPDTLETMDVIADAYYFRRLYKEAESLRRELLGLQDRVLGPEHPNTLWSINSLGDICYSQGRFQEAEALYRKALDGQKRVLGPEHADTLNSMNGLGSAYEAQRRFQEADSIHREVLEIQKRVLGPDHVETLNSMTRFAAECSARGRFKEAEPLYREAFEIQKRALGPEHVGTLKSMNGLGRAYRGQGRYAEAAALFREALDIEKQALGADHARTLLSIYNLACIDAARGDRSRALYGLRQVVERGWKDADGMARDDDLKSLRGDPAFKTLVARARENAAKSK